MSRTIDTETQYLTRDVVAAKVVDGILDGQLINSLIFSNAKPFRPNGHKVNMKYQKSTAMGWYTGMGNFDVTQQKNLVQMTWTPASVYGSVTLPYFELSVNKAEPVIQQERFAMESAAQDLLDNIADAFYGDKVKSVAEPV